MRKLAKTPRKRKTLALAVGAAFLLLGGAPVRAAAAEKSEYTYDDNASHTTGTTYDDPGDSGAGSEATAANPGKYVGLGTTGSEWFTSFVGGSGVKGVWQPAAADGNRLIVDYPGSGDAPAFVFGGVAEALSNETVTGNEVHYSGGGVSAGVLIGGVSCYGSAGGNKVFYYGGGLDGLTYSGVKYAVIGGAAVGSSAQAAQAGQNEVHLTGSGNIGGGVVGGLILDNGSASEAFENSVVITDYSGATMGVYGGKVEGGAGTARGNKILIDGGAVNSGDIYGGWVDSSGTAGGNEVTIRAGGVVTGFIYGGYAKSGSSIVSGNHVTLQDSAAAHSTVYGGYVYGGEASGNHVTLQDSATVGYFTVYGGYAFDGNSAVCGNYVILRDNAAANGSIYGGYAARGGEASGNHVILKDSAVAGFVYGGQVNFNGLANNNYVTLLDSARAFYVYGGYADNTYGSDAVGNEVWIGGGADAAGAVYGGYAYSGDAVGNKVWIGGGVVELSVYGGLASSSMESSGGDAVGNKVWIGGGAVERDIFGGRTGKGSAVGNEIWIGGGAVSGSVVGGRSSSGGDAIGNKVWIGGGAVSGSVIGGYADSGYANDNTITLTGAVTLAGATNLYGFDGNSVTGTGNTLNIYNLAQMGGNINEVKNFQFYDFKIDCGQATAAGDTVTDFALAADAVAMAGATVKGIEITGGGNKLSEGDTVGLIKATTSLASTEYNDTDEKIVDGLQGVSTLYKFDVRLNSNQLTATVLSSQANPATKALSEGWLSGLAFLNQSADLLEKAAVKEAGIQAWREQGTAVFAATGYSDARHNTGSHVDVKGPSLVVGLASAKETARGTRLTFGGFIEAGWGSYDSYNSFSGVGEVRGEGDTSYCGLGVLLRADRARRGTGRLYTEGSLRAGQVKTDFASDLGAPGTNACYNAKAVYYGLHLGLGYIRDLKGNASLDLYTKLLYTRMGSESLNVAGDPVELGAVSSVRCRVGARYVKAVGDKSEFYAGLAYDHEFDGKAKGTAGGSAIAAPKLKGGTGIGELGVILKGKNLHVDLKLEGYAGRREGFGGGVQFKWFF